MPSSLQRSSPTPGNTFEQDLRNLVKPEALQQDQLRPGSAKQQAVGVRDFRKTERGGQEHDQHQQQVELHVQRRAFEVESEQQALYQEGQP